MTRKTASPEPYVLAIDIGTSSARVLVFDARGQPVEPYGTSEGHSPTLTADGGSEMDPDALLHRVFGCLDTLSDQLRDRPLPIAGVGFSTFWHSVLGVDEGGRAVTPLLLWSDIRSRPEADLLRSRLDERAVHARTGCVFHPSYAPAKLLWFRRNCPEAAGRVSRWVSIGEYLFLKLFGTAGCGVSMASGTGLLNLTRLEWDAEVLAACGWGPEHLSPVVDSASFQSGLAGEYAGRWPLLKDIPWFPAAGDGACSNLGCGGADGRRAAVMVGTSGALRLVRAGSAPSPPWGLWCYLIDRRRYLLGGALSNGGNLMTWLRETLRLGEPDEVEAEVAALSPDSHGLTILPFLAGERNPGWHGDARGTVTGLALHTRPVDIVRACMEAVAYRFAAIHDLLSGLTPGGLEMVATGGALLSSPVWMWILADVLGQPVHPSQEPEASSRGAALLALEALGAIDSAEDAPARLGDPVLPTPENQAAYQAARARHEQWYRQVVEGAG